MQKQRVSALLVNSDNAQILLIKRFKGGRTYWVFPGGGVEPNETLLQAIVREIFEETMLKIDNPEAIFSVINRGRKEHFFLVRVPYFEQSYYRKARSLKLRTVTMYMNILGLRLVI